MTNPTHAGGIVFRQDPGGTLILVVRALSAEEEWIFPKGHIECVGDRTESPEETARREVEEETGVIAEVVAPLGQLSFRKCDETVCAEMFLMRYVAEGQRAETRETRWVNLEDARQMLGHDDARSLLDKAREAL